MNHIIITAVCAIWILTGLGIHSGVCQDRPVALKLGHAVAPEHPYHLGAVKYAERVAQRTGNKVKIDVFPSTQLGNERDMVEGLQLGTIDLVVTSTGPLGGFVPKMFVVDLPFLFRDREHAYKVLDGPIGALFAGGFLPAFVMATALMIQLNVQARKAGVPPGQWQGIKPLAKAFKESILALFMPIIIFGGILGGVCTPTEAAVLEGVPALIMTVPILLPIATEFGIDPVHFGIILIANMGIGLFLPPVGLGVFIGCSIGKITVSEVARPLLPYLAVNFATVLLITYWPWLTMAIPGLLFK